MTRRAKPNVEKGNKKSAQKVVRDNQFFGIILACAYLNESTAFAIKIFENFYPEQLSEKRLYELANEFREDYYGEQ